MLNTVYIGVVSAYISNRATGETLPGLGVIRDVRQFQALIEHFKSLDDAKQKETSPVATPSTPPPETPPPKPPDESNK